LSPLTVLDAAPPDQVTAAAEAGFDALGVRVWPAADERVYPMLGDTPTTRETLARLRDTHLRVLDVELVMLRPDSRPEDAYQVLDAAARLGARFVNVVGYDPDESRLVDRFAALCEAASARGVRPGLEFMVYSTVRTLRDALRVVARAGQTNAAVVVDALHLRRSGGSPSDLAGVPAEQLPYAQLCDAPLEPVRPDDARARVEARTARLLPGDGELPLRELVDALPPGTALSVETPVAALADRPPAERARLAYAAAVRLLASPAGDD
jgi:sugar phosphate isomerase/epimerase